MAPAQPGEEAAALAGNPCPQPYTQAHIQELWELPACSPRFTAAPAWAHTTTALRAWASVTHSHHRSPDWHREPPWCFPQHREWGAVTHRVERRVVHPAAPQGRPGPGDRGELWGLCATQGSVCHPPRPCATRPLAEHQYSLCGRGRRKLQSHGGSERGPAPLSALSAPSPGHALTHSPARRNHRAQAGSEGHRGSRSSWGRALHANCSTRLGASGHRDGHWGCAALHSHATTPAGWRNATPAWHLLPLCPSRPLLPPALGSGVGQEPRHVSHGGRRCWDLFPAASQVKAGHVQGVESPVTLDACPSH